VPRPPHLFPALSLLLAGAIMLPLLIAGANAWLVWHQTWQAAERELDHVTDAAAEYARRLLDGHRTAADRVNDLLRGLPDKTIRARESELHAALQAMIAELPQVETAYVTDRNGRLLVTGSVYPVPDLDFSDREYHVRLAAPNAPATVVTRVYQGRAENNLFFAVARPRRNTGNGLPPTVFDGQANVSVDPRRVGAELRGLLREETDSVGLVRADGHVLARHPAFDQPLPQLSTTGPFAEALASGRPGTTLTASRLDGEVRLFAHRPVAGWPGLFVGAARPRAAIVAKWQAAAAAQAAFALPAMLALAALALLVRRGNARLASVNASLERRVEERAAALRQSEARLRLATESAGVGTWEQDLRTGQGHWSPEAAALFSTARSAFTADDWLLDVHPDDRAAAAQAWRDAARNGAPYQVMFRAAQPQADGSPRWLLSRGRVEYDGAGGALRGAGVLVDITALRRVEAALRASEARFRASQELSPIGFAIHRAVRDENGTVVDFAVEYANPAAHRMVGAHPGELEGSRMIARVPKAETDPALLPRYIRILSGEQPGDDVEVNIQSPRFPGWFRNAVIRIDEERLAVSLEDITAEKEAADALARSHAELESLVEARTAALLHAADERRRAEEAARQSEKLAALGQLVGGVAHDFNNLLQVISSGAALLGRPGVAEARRQAILGGMIRAGDTARELTSHLLAFARQQPLAPETFNLNTRLVAMSELLRQTLGAGVRVETDLAPDLWEVHADPGQLELTVLNLAVNARDAMPAGGRIVLRTRNAIPGTSAGASGAGEHVRLEVEDTGMGMAPAVLARAMDPFFTTKEPGKGTGLGLPQVFGFAKQSGGDIHIASAPEKGTTVTLYLPRAEASPILDATPDATPDSTPDATPDSTGDAATAAPGSMRSPKHKSVLVVEDNGAAGEFAASLLEELGYRAFLAKDAATAQAMIRQGPLIDAVFADVVLPGGMSGAELAVALRQFHPHIAVVLATGYSTQSAPNVAPPGVETLPKPYQLMELAAALSRAFAATNGNARTAEAVAR